MQISETITGEVAITQDGVTIMISQSEAFDLLDWLNDRRDQLYQANQATWDEETWELHRRAEALAHEQRALADAATIAFMDDLDEQVQQGMEERIAQIERNPWERFADHIHQHGDKNIHQQKPWLPVQPGEEF